MTRNAKSVIASAAGLGVLAVGGYALLSAWSSWRERSAERQIGRYSATIERCGREQDLPVELIRSVILAESRGDAGAVSATGAKGLMQIMPDAERDALARLKIPQGNLFDGDYNIRIGTAYLRKLLNQFDGDVYLALAAYNWGPTNVRQAQQDHPGLTGRQIVAQFAPQVTREYCERIIAGRWEKLV